MRKLTFLSFLSVLFATACGGGNSGAPAAPGAASFLQSVRASPDDVARKDTWLYVGGSNNVINVYDLSQPGNPLVSLFTQGISGPSGVYVGPKGKLYVANSNNTVTEYPFGETVPIVTLNVTKPTSTALNPLNGHLYVATRGNPPGIAVYRPNESVPFKYVVSPLFVVPSQIIFDSIGTLYIADNQTGVSMIQPNKFRVTSMQLKGLNTCTSGLALDQTSASLFVSSCTGGIQVYTLGNPYPVRTLNETFPADYLASGAVKGQTYVFAPNVQSNTVTLFRSDNDNAFETITTASQNALGVSIKPKGIPP